MMCTHDYCRGLAADYRRVQAEAASNRGDEATAARLYNEAAECLVEMVACKIPLKDKES